jgi:hypothetical protein
MILACIVSVLGGALLLPLAFILTRVDHAVYGFDFQSVTQESLCFFSPGSSLIQNTIHGCRVMPLYGG